MLKWAIWHFPFNIIRVEELVIFVVGFMDVSFLCRRSRVVLPHT
jgi:hypothetical protein